MPDERLDEAAFAAAAKRFEREYETLFGQGATYTLAGFEVVGARVTATGQLPPPAMVASGEGIALVGRRPILFDIKAGSVDTAIWRTAPPSTRSSTRSSGPGCSLPRRRCGSRCKACRGRRP